MAITWEERMAASAAVRLAAQREAEWAAMPDYQWRPYGPPPPRPDNWCVVCWEDWQWPNWYMWDGRDETAWIPGHRVAYNHWDPELVVSPELAALVDDDAMCHCACHHEPVFAAVIAIGASA